MSFSYQGVNVDSSGCLLWIFTDCSAYSCNGNMVDEQSLGRLTSSEHAGESTVTIKPGVIIDERYQIIRPLGQGGMGSLYQVLELELERVIAVKMLLVDGENVTASKENRQRFKQEGQVLASLRHRNLVICYRLGMWKSNLYIAMEYLEGRSLADLIDNEGYISVSVCLSIATQVCQGMTCVHEAGIVHRDLKPSNIYLVQQENGNPDLVKILDFGLARIEQTVEGQNITQTGAVVGTVFYMSPEQCVGKKVDKRSDIYSLGCILYKALTGVPPYDADNSVSLMELHVSGALPDLTIPGQSAPAGLENVIIKALQKDPDDRYQSMFELQKDLELVLANRGEEIKTESRSVKGRSRSRNTGAVFAGTSLFVVSLSFLLYQYKQAFWTPVVFKQEHRKLESKLIMDPTVSLRRISLSLGEIAVKPPEKAKASLFELERTIDEIVQRIPSDNSALKYQAHMVKASLYRTIRTLEPSSNGLEQEKSEEEQALALVRDTVGQGSRVEGVVYGRMAQTALSTNDIEQAEKLYTQALDLVSNAEPSTELVLDKELPGAEPYNAMAQYELALGRCQSARKDFKKAEYWLRKCRIQAPELSGDGLSAVRELALVLLLAGRPEDRIKLLKQIEATGREQAASHILTDDKYASVLAVIALAYVESQELDLAFQFLSAAVKRLDSTAEPTNISSVAAALNSVKLLAAAQNRSSMKSRFKEMELRLRQLY